ncbi:small oligopeptide transporter [Mollisia scopiformis]|uniref:Small oligopeptide transporter n=1 Tax=Mollisia scopiformis TaxID=149040 RepID=A0A194X7L3_MOLSC|nr:small oligopeptide transporter [Mollisia scopiformis]KUJ16094.1 small oligopeptide transporter [Mollisia scopiformis]
MFEKDTGKSSSRDVQEAEANRKLAIFERAHRWDPNLEDSQLDDIDDAVNTRDPNAEGKIYDEVFENSPYPEVRAAVRNYDVDLPANTVRAWVIGMLLNTIASGLNALFSMRAPTLTITSIVAQLVAYPLGVGWSKVMPSRTFNTCGLRWSLNPGPFNLKEHGLIVIMANAAFGSGVAYFTDTLVAQRGFYGQNFGWGFNILFAVTTQCIGFGIAGLMRRYLVEPASMIWPQTLVNTAFIYALHDHSKTDPAKSNGWSIARYRWFFYVFIGSFTWYWFPGYIAKFLSVFAFVTWIRPKSPTINQIFGGWTGISLIPITFDWTQITGYNLKSPLIPPWFAIANTLVGTIFWFWIVTSALHFSGHWYAEYLPISDSNSYDNTGKAYNVTRILTPEYTLDVAKYQKYSPLFLSTTFSLSYGLAFASIAAVLFHTILFHGQEIWIQARSVRGALDDNHTKMMRKYKPVPGWWYGALFLVMIGLSFATALAWPTHLSWWALVIGLLISIVWTIPIGVIYATTNIHLGLNVFTEYIIGYMQPGRPVAMMLFKTYGYITMNQAHAFLADLKLGHYLKIPQRVTFFGQVIGAVWSCFVQLAVMEWALGHISDICKSGQANNFTCPNARVFFNASVIFGLIGPKRIFSGDATYAGLQWFWLAGSVTPFLIYFGARMFPRSKIRFFSAPIFFGGMLQLPPATPLSYLSWCIVGFVFQKLIRNRFRGWWMRFNYITSAGMDVGLAICTILIIAALNLTTTTFPDWWGNRAPAGTLDYLETAFQKKVAKGSTFGPATWS